MEINLWWILCNFWSIKHKIFGFYATPPPSSLPEGAVRSKNYIAFLPWQDFHCHSYMWPYFLGFCTIFSALSQKSIIELRNHLKQNRFTRHCSRNTKILKFSELKICLSNSPSKKQGHIWPRQWEIGLSFDVERSVLSFRFCWHH
jgi:hypothetical protein